ncbi:ABC transporter ATP-binding protein [Blastomonas sp.]|uniref:ABC transporter transmembrane domain-containing protein n=1 Tax=Blastomonas sp. TaxID=1909299 RepID=UPI00260C3C37|nr:ABC transporter ATP-binding protein [Blastomonas sp.]MDM7954832.1 ABC transporter ATP-binding protein [Blastomonas sp.]
MAAASGHVMGAREAVRWMLGLLKGERSFIWLALIYGVAVSVLSLATPISVQMLINSVANTALVTPLVTLAGTLLGLLLIAVLLSALRIYAMELFTRRFYARQVAEITLRSIHARNPFFEDTKRQDLFNRYFDVVTVQKAVPSLLIGGFTIILQSVVGFVVTAFYHPFFLAFNLIVIGLAFMILLVWTRGAIRSGIAMSHAKYAAAGWLENVGASNGFYKSGRHVDYALDRSEAVTSDYIAAKAKHFRYTLSQTVAFLLLYAFASAGLLALGGWLVIQGELSIGQLVAAELILSAAFFGLGQMGAYLDITYDLVAAAEEIGLIYQIEQEEEAREGEDAISGSDLVLRGVTHPSTASGITLNIAIAAGSQIIAQAQTHEVQRLFTHAMKRYITPSTGIVTLGGQDIAMVDMFRLRSEIIVLDRPTIVQASIRDYLRLAGATVTSSDILRALALVGLDDRVTELPEGLDTQLSTSGWPLSYAESLRLKLAGAMLKCPRILILTGLFDMVEPVILQNVRDALHAAGSTMIQFSYRPEANSDCRYLWLGKNGQQILEDPDEFLALTRRHGMEERNGHA